MFRAGGEDHLVVPIHDTQDAFAASPYRAYRYLVVRQQQGQAVEGTLIELLVERAGQEPADLATLFHELYLAQRAGKRYAPPGLRGAAFFYTVDYAYVTGYRYAQGRADGGPTRLKMMDKPRPLDKENSRDLIDGVTTNDDENWQGPNPGSPENPAILPGVTINPPPTPPVIIWPSTPTPTFPGISSPSPGWGGGGGGDGGNNASALVNQIYSNKLALYPCPGLTNNWLPLLQYAPQRSVIQRLENLTAEEKARIFHTPHGPVTTAADNWSIQAIESAGGIACNFDYYAVAVQQLPNGFNSPEDFLTCMRLTINNYLYPLFTSFSPHPSLQGESNIWTSSNPLGAILSIGAPGNNGSVIVSDYASDHWTFSTIHDPQYDNHPVSGNREFGFEVTGDGYLFYTRGVDRVDSRFVEWLGSATNPSLPLKVGHNA